MNEQLQHKIEKLARTKEFNRIAGVLTKYNFHTIATIISHIEFSKIEIFTSLPPEIQSEVILVLNNESKEIIIPKMSVHDLARMLHFNDEDDAADILQYLPEKKFATILTQIKEQKRKKIEKLLKFGKETAGGLMDMNFIIVKEAFTFKDIAEKVQIHIDKDGRVPFVFLTKEDGEISGYIPHKNLILSPPGTSAKRLARPLDTIHHSLDQERILDFLQSVRSEAIGVIGEHNEILGVIHVRDLLRVAVSEATEDIYHFAGVEKEEHITDSIQAKVIHRYKWLIINLGTAFLAAGVVSLFEGTIEKVAMLAVYMPIVAGEGGNAATQALAVVVRGLAMGDVAWSEAKKVIFRESIAGMINGIITGIIAAGVAILMHAPPLLGLILMIAMITNLFIAGFFGALIPFVLKRLNVDPAVASSIFVTTATDIIGFFVFLGLGTLLLL